MDMLRNHDWATQANWYFVYSAICSYVIVRYIMLDNLCRRLPIVLINQNLINLSGKHILCEKPLAKEISVIVQCYRIAREKGVGLLCAFNRQALYLRISA